MEDRPQPPPCNRCTAETGRLVNLQPDTRKPAGWFVCPICCGEQKLYPTWRVKLQVEKRLAR